MSGLRQLLGAVVLLLACAILAYAAFGIFKSLPAIMKDADAGGEKIGLNLLVALGGFTVVGIAYLILPESGRARIRAIFRR